MSRISGKASEFTNGSDLDLFLTLVYFFIIVVIVFGTCFDIALEELGFALLRSSEFVGRGL